MSGKLESGRHLLLPASGTSLGIVTQGIEISAASALAHAVSVDESVILTAPQLLLCKLGDFKENDAADKVTGGITKRICHL